MAEARPRILYPPELPITARAQEIIRAIRTRRVVIISGETGCGKSTQIPKMCLEAGRGGGAGASGSSTARPAIIGVTQPRRLAAVTIAYRIAEEMGEPLGRSVGYKIRFQDRSPALRTGAIKVMTDGILLAETQGDRLLSAYDTIIIDEAHERSLNIDFLLGILRKLLDARPDLHVVITSATLDTEKFSRAFRNAPVIEVSGRLYPVDVEYRVPDLDEAEDKDYVDQAVEAVEYLRREKPPGDILVFMPTEQDILETRRMLEGRKFPQTTVLPLFSRLPAGQQRAVYTVAGPKIVVATNVAETSLTIPGIRYVVDTGVARIAQYQPGTRINSLPISPISRASADQRKGRCGRVREGLCVRLYTEEEYLQRDEFTAPEILRSDLAEVILRMIDLRLGDPLEFPFIDRPAAKAVRDGYDTLVELGAITKSPWALTEVGRVMARIQLDPRVSRMLIEAGRENCLPEVGVIAAALSVRDPRERPPDQTAQADAVHAAFRHPDSDFLVLLNIWNRYHGDFEKLPNLAQRRKFCHENFLSFPRMREWVYLHEEIMGVLRELRRSAGFGRRGAPAPAHDHDAHLHPDVSPVLYAGIHRSILAGYLSNIAAHKEKNMYAAAKNRDVMLWPGSVLFNKSAGWLVATEIVRTSRLFARQAGRIDPSWLEQIGGPLCKRTYSDAAWDRARGEVVAKERVTLFGLEIVRERRVSYGRINPDEAHEIFVMSGLVEGEIDDPPPFLVHNRALQKKVEAMEEKLRRRDILVAEREIAKFYSGRLPGIRDVRSLAKLIRDKGGDDFLRLTEDEVVNYKPDEEAVGAFPDTVEVAGRPFKALYRFAPGEEDDGVTLKVPASLIAAIPPDRLDWGVPGQYKDKIAALIKGLPKRYRKLLVPVGEKAETIAAEMPQAPEDVPLAKAVADFVRRKWGVDIPAREWAQADVPKYLRMRVAVVDPVTGRVIDAGRDVELLRKKLGAEDAAPAKVESPAWREAARRWEKSGIRAWTFGDLPEKVAVGTSLTGYPALAAEQGADPGSISIRLFATAGEAKASHLCGVRWLLMRRFGKDLAFVRRYHQIPAEYERAAARFGGRAEVEAEIERALAREVFEKDIRTEAGFKAYESAVGKALFEKGHALTQTTLKVLGLVQAIRDELGKGSGKASGAAAKASGVTAARMGGVASPKGSSGRGTSADADRRARLTAKNALSFADLDKLKERAARVGAGMGGGVGAGAGAEAGAVAAPAYLEQVAADIESLVPMDFLGVYAVDRLVRIPRYLEALKIRLARARIDPEKDRQKAAQVEPYALELERLEREVERGAGAVAGGCGAGSAAGRGGASGSSSILESTDEAERRAAVDELRWMIEEFKIALFAPEIKTAFPISAVRLAKKIKELGSDQVK